MQYVDVSMCGLLKCNHRVSICVCVLVCVDTVRGNHSMECNGEKESERGEQLIGRKRSIDEDKRNVEQSWNENKRKEKKRKMLTANLFRHIVILYVWTAESHTLYIHTNTHSYEQIQRSFSLTMRATLCNKEITLQLCFRNANRHQFLNAILPFTAETSFIEYASFHLTA